MKILSFGVDIKNEKFEIEYALEEEEFFKKVLSKKYDILIINFNFLSSFLEIKRFFDGVVIFVYDFVDGLIYKRALEVGDYFYLFSEMWKIDFRLEYIAKKLNKKRVFIFKDLVFDLKTKELYKNRENVKLTPAEKDILEFLIRNRNSYISKEFILENSENIDNISSIKVLISKLRKLGFNIDNQKNLGYRIKEEK